MKPRRLKLASGIWRFVVGRGFTTLWSPSGKKMVFRNRPPLAKSICGCGEPYNCLPSRAVTPGSLRYFIEEFLLAPEPVLP